jgi:thioredoxin reductase (NADPH)
MAEIKVYGTPWCPDRRRSMPGVFAAGDVRSGSTKQLAAATGEGATALLMVRQHLERLGDVAARGVPAS